MIIPTLQEIKELHCCLKKEMPEFYILDNYMNWEVEESSESCPPEKTLWINSAYIENTDYILEIWKNTLGKDISFSEIEKHSLEDTIYAKVRGNESKCHVLKNNVCNLLKETHFSIKIEEESVDSEEKTTCISLIIEARQDQNTNEKKITLRKENVSSDTELSSRKVTYENVIKILKLLLCHVITINPAQENKEVVKVFGKLGYKTRELLRNILDNNFIKAFINTYEDNYRCLNPFYSFFRKDFENVTFESMWAKEQQFSLSSVSNEEIELINSIYSSNINFKSYFLECSEKFYPMKLEDKNPDDIVFYVRDMDDDWIMKSISKVQVGNKLVRVCNLYEEQQKNAYIIKKNLSEQDSKRINKIWSKSENKEFKKLSPEDEVISNNIIHASESQWLSRFQMFIKQLIIVAENIKSKEKFKAKYPSWQKGVDYQLIHLNSVEDINKLKKKLKELAEKYNREEYDIVQELAKDIDFRRRKAKEKKVKNDVVKKLAKDIDVRRRKAKEIKEEYEQVIDESELSIILAMLLKFIKNNPSDWPKLAIQCIIAFSLKEPDKINGDKNQSKPKSFIDLIRKLQNTQLRKRIIDAYLEDLQLATYKRDDNKLYELVKRINRNKALDEEVASIGIYKQDNEQTALYENSVQIGKRYHKK